MNAFRKRFSHSMDERENIAFSVCQRLYLIDFVVVAGCVVRAICGVRVVVVVIVLEVIVVRGVVLGAAVVVIAVVGCRRCASVVAVLPRRVGVVTTLLVGGSTKFVAVGLNTFLKSSS